MTQAGLFDAAQGSSPMWEPVHGSEDAQTGKPSVWLRRDFAAPTEADALFETLRDAIPWRQDELRMFGKRHLIPRLHQWYGDASYTWSGIEMQPLVWTPTLDDLRRRVETATRRRFNSALINYYRDGEDSVGWHADDEPELGPAPFIASVSLGAPRDFVLRRNEARDEGNDRLVVELPHGSLLVMAEGVQARWQHTLPRRKRVRAGRINLTFRLMHPQR